LTKFQVQPVMWNTSTFCPCIDWCNLIITIYCWC
jgi:hypothetical protein